MVRTFLFLTCSVCLIGCTPRVIKSDYQNNIVAKPLPGDSEYFLFESGDVLPAAAQQIGSLKITENGFSVGCSYAQVLELARENTLKTGGNAFKITSHQKPDIWSTCHRISGDMFLLSPEGISGMKKKTSIDLDKIKARQKFLYDSLVMEAGGNSANVQTSQQPQFPGGEQAMMQYLSKSVKYPATAIKDKVGGLNVTTFVVDENGEILEVKMLKSIREDLDEESMRIIRSMPRWIPGFQNGKAVKVRYNIPMTYSIGRK